MAVNNSLVKSKGQQRLGLTAYLTQEAVKNNINQVVGAVNPENSTDAQKGYLGAALGFRAMCYLDLARMYEFLPTEVFPDGKNADGNVVTNLTCPIVSNETTPSEAANKIGRAHV